MKGKKFLIGGIIIFLAVGALSTMALQGATTYYYTVSELSQQSSVLNGQNVRVAGTVAPNSVERSGNTLRFSIVDTQNSLSVIYKGVVPDAFKEGNDAVVEGRLSPTGSFEAKSIIVKCPSKYVPKE